MPEVAMKRLLENLSVFTEALGGLNELRRVILTLAIRGQLEPQDLNEVGVGVALSKVREQKGAVLKVKGSELQRIPEIREFPFDLPPNWEFARIDDTGEYINGCAFQSSEHGTVGLPIIRIQNLTNPAATFNYTNRELDSKNIAEAGDVLVSWSATLDSFIWTGTRAAVNQHIFKVEPNEEIAYTRFLFLALKWAVQNLANSDALHGSAMKHINRGNFISTVVPVPSLDMQSETVAKVDELMALCDQLEEAQATRDSIRTAARNSAIDAVATASTSQELEVAWNRISSNWDVMADTLESVEDLRRLILMLAVQGNLLDTASRELGRINPVVAGDEQTPYRATLGELCNIYQPKTISTSEMKSDGQYLVYGANGVIGRYDKYNHEESEVLVTCRGATCGRVNVSTPLVWINGNAMVVSPKNADLIKPYLAVVLRGLDYDPIISGTAQPQITKQPLSKISISVPSLDVQSETVAKVDQLMALCDQLEEQLKSRNAIAKKFARSVTASESL